MRDRVCLRIFPKCAKSSRKHQTVPTTVLLLAIIFTIVLSSSWKSIGVECSKSDTDKLGKINNTISVRVGEMTVLSNELSVRFPKVDAVPKLNVTTKGTNSTLDLALTTKRSLVGQSETPKPSTKPKISTTERITEAELKTIDDDDVNSLENELDDSLIKSSETVDAPEGNEFISNELDIEVPSNDDTETAIDDDTDPTLSVSNENEFYAEDADEDDDDGTLRSSVTPKYKTTSVITSPPLATLDVDESNESPETINDIVFFSSTPRSLGNGNYIKKIPTRLLAAANTRIKQKQKLDSATKRPKLITPRPRKKIVISTPRPRKKRPVKVTKAPRPKTATPKTVHYERDPHHPHGVVVFDRRKKRPKPTRRMTTTTTTTTTTEEPSVVDLDYYDYYLSSGENAVEFTGPSSSNSNKTISRIPLSKLALAMLASSAGFDNGTDDLVYFPKTPINLLNILQAYTKQLQVASTETFKPPLKIERQPFMVHLNGLNFAAKVGISVYYSLIAIIPLVYLAFGGLGRLGLSAFVGRNLALLGRGKKRRRKRRSFDEHYYHYYGGYNNHFSKGTFQANTIKRIHLKDQDLEDEYSWILGRISEVIWELSQVPYELNHPQV